jgi:hypothetical protein
LIHDNGKHAARQDPGYQSCRGAKSEQLDCKRLRELGIRVALGAQRKEVLQAVLGRAIKVRDLDAGLPLLPPSPTWPLGSMALAKVRIINTAIIA